MPDRSLSDIDLRDEVKVVLADARPQVRSLPPLNTAR